MNDKPITPEELDARITAIEKQLALPPSHYHNGFDSNKISWIDIDQKKLFIQHTIIGADAATAANYGVFFIVPMPAYVASVREVHQTAGTDGGAVTLTIEKLTSTQALDAGVSVLNSTINLKGSANTVVSPTITGTAANRSLARNDRLAMKDAGTLTSVANVTVLVELQLL